jgi:hypothetical protein
MPDNLVVTQIDTAVEKLARGHAQSLSAGTGEEGSPGDPDGENPNDPVEPGGGEKRK